MKKSPVFESYEVALEQININIDKVPLALCLVQNMQKVSAGKPMIVLFDSGSSHTWIKSTAIPKGCTPRIVDGASQSRTLSGTLSSNREVTLNRVVFPEFFQSHYVDTIPARVFNTDCRYDAIIGRDVLRDMGLKIDFASNSMIWDDC